MSIGKCYSLSNDNNNCVKAITSQSYKMICINDNGRVAIESFDKEKDIIKNAFQLILPDKSSFEI